MRRQEFQTVVASGLYGRMRVGLQPHARWDISSVASSGPCVTGAHRRAAGVNRPETNSFRPQMPMRRFCRAPLFDFRIKRGNRRRGWQGIAMRHSESDGYFSDGYFAWVRPGKTSIFFGQRSTLSLRLELVPQKLEQFECTELFFKAFIGFLIQARPDFIDE